MSKFNTGNPVGSTDPRDLSDSAQVADELINGGGTEYPDRLGRPLKSWTGMESDFSAAQSQRASDFVAEQSQRESDFTSEKSDRQGRFSNFIASSAYIGTGTNGAIENYAAGIDLTEYNQIVRDSNGEFWRASGSTALPYTTTGAGLPESGALVSVGDAALRQELALPVSGGSGAILINGAVAYVDSVADMKAIPSGFLKNGQVIVTSGYYSAGDGGHAEYLISMDSSVDEYSSFSLGDGYYAHLQHDGVVKSTQFGVIPDGVTNWEAVEGQRMIALYSALNAGIEVRFVKVGSDNLYFTGMNIYNYYAQEWTMSFGEGVEFGNILHIISSGTAIFNRTVSVAIGTNPTITFAEPHGMATERYCDFSGTGTSLDGGSFLVTPVDSTTATVEAEVTGTDTGSGVASDTPIRNVRLKGTFTTYDRWGLINADGLKADRVVCKSDPSKHTTGQEGGGVHIFTMCKNFDIGEVVVEDTKDQAASANMHAAYAQDGVGLENISVGRVWIKDTKVNGAIIAGKNVTIKTIQVDAYGRGVMSSAIPFSGTEDLYGQTSASRAHGVWLSRCSGSIDSIMIDQKKGFSGRDFAQKDVCFDRDFITWSSANLESNTDTQEGIHVGHIQCFNPQYVGVDIGPYKQWSRPSIDKITFGIISDNNDAVLNDSQRLERGLVNIGYSRASIGQIVAPDHKEATLLLNASVYRVGITPGMGHNPAVNVGSIEVGHYHGRVVHLHCPHHIGSVRLDDCTVKDSYYLEPAIDINQNAQGCYLGTLYSKLASAINKSLLKYSANSGSIGQVLAHNYIANQSSNDAVIHISSAKYSTINSLRVDADSTGASSGGIKFTGTYNFQINNALVDNMNQGVIDGGGNGRLMAVGCVSLSNTTASDLPPSALVVDQGNFQWTV